MKRIILLALALLLFIFPVLGAETVTKENYAEPIIKVNNKTFIPNETILVFDQKEYVWISYVIEPKTDDDAKKIDNREYDIRTDLEDASLKYRVVFGSGASISRSGFTIDVPDADDLDGVKMIELNLTGYTPSIDHRLKEISALKIWVQDGGYVLPEVKVYVIDLNKFSSDLSNAKSKLSEMNTFIANYTGKVDVSTLKSYVDNAKDNLTLAEEHFNNKDYAKADEKLRNAEFWLEKAEKEKVGVEARYLYSEADESLKELGTILNKIEVYLEEVEEKNLVNTSTLIDYKTDYSGLKNKFDDITSDLAIAKGYIDTGSYEGAKSKLESILSECENVKVEAEKLLNELSSYVKGTPATEQPQIPEIKLPEIDWRLVGFYAGIAGGAVVGLTLVVIALRRYIRRRRWDELK